ncbi:MAG: phosphomannose isomerase type II C-terminal cupin domain [Candidatus Omnitrophota bacterium]
MKSQKKDHVQRPWGNYYKLFQDAGVWVKRVEVKPKSRISLQKHHKRSEKWIVVSGQGLAIVNDQEIPVHPGSVVDIPLESIHRIGNSGESPLVFIEVACGEYLAEDDITRLHDDYSRDCA